MKPSIQNHYHPDITIAAIIPTFRRGAYLVDTLQSLISQSRVPDEILVIDQTPDEEYDSNTLAYLREESGKGVFKWLRQPFPSVSRARNRAILEAKSDVLLYLDDDIVPSEDLVKNHIAHYKDDSVSAVVGAIFLPNIKNYIKKPHNFEKLSLVEQAFNYSTRYDSYLKGIGFSYGGNISVRKGVLMDIGGWDEHIINYGDRDLGIRLAQSGYRIDYDPESWIIHLCAPMGGTRVTDKRTPWKGWQRCVSVLYLGFRHLRGVMFLKYGLYRGARFSFLLRQNALRPWLWPGEIFGYVKALLVAKQWSKEGVVSPFVDQVKRIETGNSNAGGKE